MEPNELKNAWLQLGQRLERQEAVQLELLRDRKRDRMRGSLRPLFWGQILQVVFGVALIVLGVACWTRHPAGSGYFVAGLLVHALGVATAAAGGILSGLIGSLDYAAPVLAIQKRLGLIRRFYVCSAAAVGLPWWIMWVVVVVAAAGLKAPPGPTPATPAWIWVSLAIGVAGLLATWWFHRWSHAPDRPGLAQRLRDGATGPSLRRAQNLLDELAEFERE